MVFVYVCDIHFFLHYYYKFLHYYYQLFDIIEDPVVVFFKSTFPFVDEKIVWSFKVTAVHRLGNCYIFFFRYLVTSRCEMTCCHERALYGRQFLVALFLTAATIFLKLSIIQYLFIWHKFWVHYIFTSTRTESAKLSFWMLFMFC